MTQIIKKYLTWAVAAATAACILILSTAACFASQTMENVEKRIALTYDDGPHEKYTPMILDVLKKHNAHATFFMVGMRAEKLPEIVSRIHKEGHSMGNHTYDHADLTQIGDKGVTTQIKRTNDIIEGITGARPILMRPPLGARNKHILEIIKNMNMFTILWNVDPLDWSHKNASRTHSAVVKKAMGGDIVILHDFYENTVMATEQILETLGAQGYQFVSIEELLRLGDKAARDEVYYNGRPDGEIWRD